MPCDARLGPALWLALLLILAGGWGRVAAADTPARGSVALARHVPTPAMLAGARLLGPLAPSTPIRAAFALPLRNQAALDDLLRRLYDPKDPLYHKYLKTGEFDVRFGPAPADVAAVTAYARSVGLSVTGTHMGGAVVDVTGSCAAVQSAFGVRLNRYLLASGDVAYANDAAPKVPQAIAAKIRGISGLTNIDLIRHPRHLRLSPPLARSILQAGGPTPKASGPAGGLSPTDIKKAYNLDKLPAALDGSGQTLGLYQLDGYDPNDLTKYVTQFNLRADVNNLQIIPVGGGVATPGANQTEVVLDISMMLALAPNAKILVYEGPNGTSAIFDLFTKIADDNLAKVISTSWGLPESLVLDTNRAIEDAAFRKMALQGQTFFDAAGDNGAFDDGSNLSVDDPGSNPFVTAVGGTKLTLQADGTWAAESTWSGGSVSAGAGGGGISTVWGIPSYQAQPGVITSASKGSTTMRNLPDVALDADPNTGYDIFVASDGGWETVGGTSAASPLWAGFMGLVNQQRALNGLDVIGFANPAIYEIGTGNNLDAPYNSVFHDISTGDNLFYPAVTGYDLATGWGSFIGDKLLNAFVPEVEKGGPPGTLAGTVTVDGAAKAGVIITVVSAATGKVYSPTPPDETNTTDADGHYSLSVPSGITYRVTADPSQIDGNTAAGHTVTGITVTDGGTTPLDFTLATIHVFSSPGLQMVSAPYDYSATADLATLLGIKPPLTSSDPRLISWQPNVGVYIFSPAFPADTFRLGQGYWLKVPADPADPTKADPTRDYIQRDGGTPATSPFTMQLQAGWNLIGDPFLDPVAVSSLQGTGGNAVWEFVPSKFQAGQYPYQTATQLQPWQGYWLFAAKSTTLTITDSAPPPPGPGGLVRRR